MVDYFLKYGNFQIRKMANFKKPPTEQDLIEWLKGGQLDLAPLRFEILDLETRFDWSDRDRFWDLTVEASWGEQRARFAIDCKSQSTPKAFSESVRRIIATPAPPGYYPMLLAPYLRETQLAELEQKQISGVDMCGNGVVIVPDVMSVYRTGGKNRFPSYAPIKNIYRKNTSMVARALLSKPSYASVQELRDEINARNLLVARWGKTPMSSGTVSKALKGLDDDLIVDRSDGIRLLQPDKLLERINLNYELPRVTNSKRLKVDCSAEDLPGLVRETSELVMAPAVATGLSSVNWYAVMQRGDILSVYCPRGEALIDQIDGREEGRFPNLEVIDTEDQRVFFDAREEKGFLWASPLQCYLELRTGDKRDQETAEQVQSYILKSLNGAGP